MTPADSQRKWEYLVVQFIGSIWKSIGEWDRPELSDLNTEQMLNHFGASGWELVMIGPVHNSSGAPSAAYTFNGQVI
ncbi:DUF4177 domain-containing protein [Sphingorhabdus sp.]|uniref:DUF4177 domain-containing protein n=1 Tax=Sphingorhabdus sp. TaxID=1902408 RepID=UPI0039834644